MTKKERTLGAPAARTAAHTPGPWKLRQAMKYGPGSTQERVNWIDDPGRFDVNGPDSDMPSIAEDVWEPDAKLIAAAPALADALELALDDDGMTCDTVEDCGCWSSLARAALRAAGRLGERSEPAEGRPSPESSTNTPRARESAAPSDSKG